MVCQFVTKNLISIKKNPYIRYDQRELDKEINWLDKKERNLKAENLFTQLKEVSDQRAFVYEALEILHKAKKLGVETSDLTPNDVIRVICGASLHELTSSTGTSELTRSPLTKLAHAFLDSFIGKA